MGIPVTAYLEGNQWGTWDAQPGTTVQIPIPTKSNSSTTWGDWQYPGTINSRYTHKVPVMGDDLSVLSYNTYYGVTLNMYRDGHYTSYPKVSTQVDYTDWGDRTAGGTISVYVSEFAVSVRIDYAFVPQDNQTREYSAYWSEGPTYDLPSQPKTGYSQNNYTSNQGSKAPGSSFSAWGVYSDVTWSTSYRKLVYTATLNKNGGTGGTNGPIYWWNGSWYSNSDATTQITSITKPTKTGYDFGGYKNSNTLVIDSNGSIVGNISDNATLVAQWTAHPYTVHFDKDGNITPSSYPESTITPSTVADVQVTYDGTYPTLPTLSRDGFTFDGWVDDDGNPVHSGDTYNPDSPSNHTLHAKWTIKQFTITVYARSGISGVYITKGSDSTTEGISSSGTYKYWDVIKLHATLSTNPPQGEEYYFRAWQLNNLDLSSDNPYEINVRSEQSFYAWGDLRTRSYTITLIAGDGVNSVSLSNTDENPPLVLTPPYVLPYNTDVLADVVEFTGQENAGGAGLLAWTGEDSTVRYKWIGWKDGTGQYFPLPETREHIYGHSFVVKEDTDLTAECKSYPKTTITLGNVTDGQIEFTEIDERWDDSRHRHLLPFSNPVWHGTQYSVRAIPNPGKMLQYWLVGNLRIEPDPDNWNILTRDVPIRNVTVRAVFDDWTYIWHHDGEDIPCHWNEHYIFIKTDDPITPWKVVKEIKINTNNGWVTSSTVD